MDVDQKTFIRIAEALERIAKTLEGLAPENIARFANNTPTVKSIATPQPSPNSTPKKTTSVVSPKGKKSCV